MILRRWVWPSLRFAVAAAIAVALVRIAFFAAEPAPEPPVATGAVEDTTVQPKRGTVTNDVSVSGSVRQVPGLPVRSTAEGTVNRVFAPNGTAVTAGAPVVDVRVETDPPATADDDVPAKPTVRFVTVTAPADGTVTGLDLVSGQAVSIGDEVATLATGRFQVTAPMTAAALYRLGSVPAAATVSIKDGPAPFACSGLQLSGVTPTNAAAGTADKPDPSGDDSASSTTLQCDVPAGVRAFPGVAADVTVAAGKAENVMVLPTTAVLGTADRGRVVVVGKGGSREEREIELGLTDGKQVEVRKGLGEQDQVLQFMPDKEVPADPDGDDGGPQ